MLNLLALDRLGDYLQSRYGQAHEARNDRALFQMAVDLKDRFMRNTPPLQKAMYDSQLQVLSHALGTQTTISRV